MDLTEGTEEGQILLDKIEAEADLNVDLNFFLKKNRQTSFLI